MLSIKIIEASHIDFGGGLVLLEVLLKRLEVQKISSFVYIKNESIKERIVSLGFNYPTIEITGTFKTLCRYMKRRNNILFFCNLPPFSNSNNSILYIHNPHLIVSPRECWRKKGETWLFWLKKKVYFNWIRFFIKRVDNVACQTEKVKSNIEANFNVIARIMSFYEDVQVLDSQKKQYDFCYVASAVQHKNHIVLLKAFEQLLKKTKATLVLTVPDSEQQIVNMINNINNVNGYQAIYNYGFVEKEQVAEIYSQSRSLVFPSLAETLGLPLIEAVQYGIKVISSDLDFSHDVVGNAITFDPNNEMDICEKMNNFLDGQYDNIKQQVKVNNSLDEIIFCLTNDSGE